MADLDEFAKALIDILAEIIITGLALVLVSIEKIGKGIEKLQRWANE